MHLEESRGDRGGCALVGVHYGCSYRCETINTFGRAIDVGGKVSASPVVKGSRRPF